MAEKTKLAIAVFSAEEHVKQFLDEPLNSAFTTVHFFEVGGRWDGRSAWPGLIWSDIRWKSVQRGAIGALARAIPRSQALEGK